MKFSEQFKQISEAKKKISFSNDVNITSLGSGKYMLEISKYSFEPTLTELQKLSQTLETEKKKLDFISSVKFNGKPAAVFVRSGDVAIGIEFRMNKADEETINANTNIEVEYRD